MAHHRKAVIHKHVYELWIIYARAQVHCSNFFPRARILNKCQGYWKKGGLDIKIQWFFWFSLWSLLESRWYRFHKEKHCDSIWSSLRTKLDFLSELHIFWFLLMGGKMWWDILDDKVWHSIFSAMFSMLWEEIW